MSNINIMCESVDSEYFLKVLTIFQMTKLQLL